MIQKGDKTLSFEIHKFIILFGIITTTAVSGAWCWKYL